MSKRPRFVALLERLRHDHPDLADPERAIAEHRVVVDGAVVANPRARVPRAAAVVVSGAASPPRGALKLAAALRGFAVPVAGRVCLDVGASTGGFTFALLAAGARRVYAVDAGHGQLLGSLRADPRVVNLERTNLAELTERVVPDVVELVTIDVSYLSLAQAAGQLARLAFAPDADLVALVKPMFELHLAGPPPDRDGPAEAVRLAIAGFERAGWSLQHEMASPVTGRHGAVEHLLHLRAR